MEQFKPRNVLLNPDHIFIAEHVVELVPGHLYLLSSNHETQLRLFDLDKGQITIVQSVKPSRPILMGDNHIAFCSNTGICSNMYSYDKQG
jgi:hypothetical protein